MVPMKATGRQTTAIASATTTSRAAALEFAILLTLSSVSLMRYCTRFHSHVYNRTPATCSGMDRSGIYRIRRNAAHPPRIRRIIRIGERLGKDCRRLRELGRVRASGKAGRRQPRRGDLDSAAPRSWSRNYDPLAFCPQRGDGRGTTPDQE